MTKSKKRRLDEILINRKLVKDKNEAFLLISEGYVIIEGQKAVSPAQIFHDSAGIKIRKKKKYVGRGALKLEAAIEKFNIDVKSKVCADIGAATGGFTQVLLNHGASKVYAIDTAYGKLDIKLREDPRVVVMEKTDIRYIGSLPGLPNGMLQIAVIDVSLIPLEQILPHTYRLLARNGEAIALLKPQYETRNPKILRHGVVTDEKARKRILEQILNWAKENSWSVLGFVASPVRGGQRGNIEYLLHLRKKP